MCDNMVKEIKMSADEAIEYVRNNVQIRDILEISYNRIFAPGEVLNIISEDEETGEGLRVSLQLNGEILNQAVDVDFNEIKDDLLELRHIKDGKITIDEHTSSIYRIDLMGVMEETPPVRSNIFAGRSTTRYLRFKI